MTGLRRLIAIGLAGLVMSGGAPSAEAAGLADLSAADLRLVDRVTWGVNESGARAFMAMGRDRWLDWQLHPRPSDTLPPAAQAQIDAMAISQHPMQALVIDLAERNKAANAIADPVAKQAAQKAYQQAMGDVARQAAARAILRDLYAPSQLREQLTWFWFNHFNVHQYKNNIRPMIADYEEHVIRDHALGRFRDMLAASVRHPAMLSYLDNAQNAVGHLNENYAREIMELHTMGVGSGYTQRDIQELARILTGLTIDPRPETPKLKPQYYAQLVRDGLFEFNPQRHDYGDKLFLGHVIRGRGLAEVTEAIDILARQPATAHHVSLQLAIFFMGAGPPEPLVQQMAATFQRSDGDIAAVLSVLFHAPAFAAAPAFATPGADAGNRFKDPVHYVLSALRLAYDDRVIVNTNPVQGWLGRMAEGLYSKETPDGYPMYAAAWNGPGQMAVRFEVARQIGSGPAGLFKATPADAELPGFPQLQNQLFYGRLQATLSPATRTALAEAISPQDWNTLFLSSPEFMF